LKETLKRLGYRFVVRKVQHPETVTGENLPIMFEIENIGVAPPYKDYFLAVRLEGGSKTYEYVSTESIKHWLPDEMHSKTLILPIDVNPGNYQISLGIVDPYDEEPAINLAIEGRDDDGWYLLSSVEVQVESCGDGHCDEPEDCTICPEDCECDCNPLSLPELFSVIDEWKLGTKNLNDVLFSIVEWKDGC